MKPKDGFQYGVTFFYKKINQKSLAKAYFSEVFEHKPNKRYKDIDVYDLSCEDQAGLREIIIYIMNELTTYGAKVYMDKARELTPKRYAILYYIFKDISDVTPTIGHYIDVIEQLSRDSFWRLFGIIENDFNF